MTQYEKVNVTLSNMQLNKLNSAYKNQTGATLRMKTKMFQGKIPHELLLTRKQKVKIHNAFSNQLVTDIKLSKVQISKIIQWCFLGALLYKLAGPIMNISSTLTKISYFHKV